MKNWWKYQVRPALHARVEACQMWVAWHLPNWLVRWTYIRVVATASSTPALCHTHAPDIRAMDALAAYESRRLS